MEIFLDINTEQALAITAFLQRCGFSDYNKILGSEEAAQDALAAGHEMILAFREEGFLVS